MPLKEPNHLATKFYQQDIVQKLSPPHGLGVVLRCWHDAEDSPSTSMSDPLMRPLQRGEVGVSFLSDGGTREILPESQIKLVDRTLQAGDFCKRSIDDLRSGVVTSVRTRARLEHVINSEPVEGWRSTDEVLFRRDAELGDYVVCEDWIGQVIELYDENIIEVSSGQLVRLPEFSSRLAVGEKGHDILPQSNSGVQNFFGFLLGNSRPGGYDTVIAVKHTVYAVAWLALNQTLDVAESQLRKRPKRFWYGQDISKLTLIRSRSDYKLHISDRVELKDTTGLPITRHGKEEDPAGVIHVQTFAVAETETMVDVLWQDGVRETIKSTDLIPYLNPDEYDCWPGDHVLWSSEGEKRAAVVQSVNASQRTATVLFSDTGNTELTSLLELDPHGTSDPDPLFAQTEDGLGVRRGDFVFIHREGSTNGFERPRVPRIGELEYWVRETPMMGGQLTGWRKEMSDLGTHIATHRGTGDFAEGNIKEPQPDDPTLSWIGEVTDLKNDGSVEVTHPNGTVCLYPLERLTKLYDGIEQLEDEVWGEDTSDMESDAIDDVWSMNPEGVWEQGHGNEDEWEEYDDDDDDDDEDDPMDYEADAWPEDAASLPPLQDSRSETPQDISPLSIRTLTERPPSPDVLKDAYVPGVDETGSDDSDALPWKRFDIISSAPVDHAYYSSTPAQPSRTFLGRLSKEYRILASSLPESIIVRAYEDRTDLLRCLIIGPQNTPYEDAPFVIDWMLDSNFPNSPPIAHFLSWTNGNGRVNPNLYEEGKVCLSILGTWAGDRNETWSAGRSSLLQAFVSIQGLVLVKDPWFCEPAYEKLRGTEEGIVNSRLYSEKAYVLSRGFVRRALEQPPGGLETEINWMYYTNHRLEKVLTESRLLIEKSKSQDQDMSPVNDDEDLAVPRLTEGGIITLERTLAKLQSLLDSPPSSS